MKKVLVLLLALLTLAAVGAGWKWGNHGRTPAQMRSATGWTWDRAPHADGWTWDRADI